MNILITGSSGLIGTALIDSLSASGHTVFRMVRNRQNDEPFYWQPNEGIINFDKSIDIETVIHLAGANISDGRWNEKRKQTIVKSREIGTKLLATTIAQLKNKPQLFISGSAIGYYGNTGTQIVDESNNAGTDFLAGVAQKWEAATKPAEEAGIRTVHIRTGVVLSADGGALKKMLLPFKMGVGGKIGTGRQYMSCVSINEVTNMIRFIIENESVMGPVNLVSPTPVTNFAFTKILGKVLNRPTIFPIPALAIRVLLGELADVVLLSSTRAIPKKLTDAGYQFIDEDLEKTLRQIHHDGGKKR